MTDSKGYHEEGYLYEDTTPEEAMLLSRTGKAKGYDDLRFGIAWQEAGKTPDTPVVRIDKRGVWWRVMSDAQKAWLAEVEEDNRRWEKRRRLIRRKNFCTWKELTEVNRNYLLSLYWVPDNPLTAMEVIARMADS